MVTDIDFHLLPCALIVTDLVAKRADRHDTPQGFDLGQRLLEVIDELFTFGKKPLMLPPQFDGFGTLLDSGDELFDVDGLDDILIDADVNGIQHVGQITVRAGNNDQNLPVLAPHGLRHLETAQDRHADICDDQIRSVSPKLLQPFPAIGCGGQLPYASSQEVLDLVPGESIVFHIQDLNIQHFRLIHAQPPLERMPH